MGGDVEVDQATATVLNHDEHVLARLETQRRCPLTRVEQEQLFDAFLTGAELVEVYYRWRPNLRDEGDSHVLELAVGECKKFCVSSRLIND